MRSRTKLVSSVSGAYVIFPNQCYQSSMLLVLNDTFGTSYVPKPPPTTPPDPTPVKKEK